MVIYNITTNVQPTIHDAWLEWMKLVHIPRIMLSGQFIDYTFSRLLDLDEEEGSTYSLQFRAESREQCDIYMQKFAPALREESAERWGNMAISFRSLMEVIN